MTFALQMLHEISKWLIALNSASNFFIYCLAGAKFRQVIFIILISKVIEPQMRHHQIQ